MPDPVTTAAIITAGSALLGGGANAASQANLNRKNRQFAREMYERTKADNLAHWQQVNDYNSPQAQMARFQAAGLNPNLIYGQGNSGPAGNIPTPDVQTPQTRAPEWGNAISAAGQSGINSIYDLQIRQAQLDNLKTQNNVLEQDAILKAAQAASTSTGTEAARFKLDFDRELRGISAEYRAEELRKTKVSTDLAINEDARRAAANSASVQEAYERMKNLAEQRLNMALNRTKDRAEIQRINADAARIRATTAGAHIDNQLKTLELGLRQKGINPNDPVWMRMVGQALTQIFESDGSVKTGSVWSWLFGK